MPYSENENKNNPSSQQGYQSLVNDTKIVLDYQDQLLHVFQSPIAEKAMIERLTTENLRLQTHKDATKRVPQAHFLRDVETRKQTLAQLNERIKICEQCVLSKERTQTVPGMGVMDPYVMVIGEAPGKDEDAQGLPFVGKSGQYLDKWLAAIQLSRHSNVYITNTVKCRPPQNRNPHTEEMQSCQAYLNEQIQLVRPQTILLLGRIAASLINPNGLALRALRQNTHTLMDLPCFVTYHPSAVLRDPSYRALVWEDLKYLAHYIETNVTNQSKLDSNTTTVQVLP